MATRKILVTGATGKQGGAVIRALTTSTPPPYSYEILALTRNTSSPSAKALASKPHVTLLKGDLNDCAAVFAAAGGKGSVWGVFSVQVPSMKKGEYEKEDIQGNTLVDVAIENDVKFFVYTSVDRGGPGKSDTTPTNIPHFASKHNIERHLMSRAEGTEMKWSVLRPVGFMENLDKNMFGKMVAAMWMNMGDKPWQLVSCKDIGIFAALAFSKPEEYAGQAISLVGDEKTQAEGNEAFWKVFGRSMPRAYWFLGNFLQYMVPEIGTMFKWFVTDGYGGSVEECKKANPGMLDLETWYKEESDFKR